MNLYVLVVMINKVNNNIVIIGAGPIGLATAIQLKSLNKNYNITIIEGRKEFTRGYALKVNRDSVKKIVATLDNCLKTADSSNPRLGEARNSTILSEMKRRKKTEDVKKIFSGWGNRRVRINDMQTNLLEQAKSLGINIEYGSISHQDLQNLKNAGSDTLKNADIIIGADGAHSAVRTVIWGQKIENNYQYFAQLKQDVASQTKQRTMTQFLKRAFTTGSVDIEFMGRATNTPGLKNNTFATFVDEDIYNIIRSPITDEDGCQVLDKNNKPMYRGQYGTEWTINELKGKAAELPEGNSKTKLCNFIHNLEKYQTNLKRSSITSEAKKNSAGPHEAGSPEGTKNNETAVKDAQSAEDTEKTKPSNDPGEAKINAIELTTYVSTETVGKQGEKILMLVGDANSGLIFERGFNKGLKEAALCATAINTYFNNRMNSEEQRINSNDALPQEIISYEKDSRELYKKEKQMVKAKNIAIRSLQAFTSLTSAVFVPVNSLMTKGRLPDKYDRPNVQENWLNI